MNRTLLLLALLLAGPQTWAQRHSSEYDEPHQRQALEIYRDTIAMRTALGHEQVPVMAHYLADRYRDGGFDDEDIQVLPYTLPGGEETASLVVRYRGDGSSGKDPILFIAHMDVVDARPEDWERDPFTLIEEDGYFFGRGTYDDKLGTTLLTANFLRLRREGFTPTRDLIVAFTGDEETDMLTIDDLVLNHRDLIDAEFAINADAGTGALTTDYEPITYLVQAAEKTYADFEIVVRNPGGHSSRPRADNAIYELADALKKIQAYEFPVRYDDITQGYFAFRGQIESGELGQAMRDFAKNPADAGAAAVLSRYPWQVGMTRTTCVATMLEAGHALNALPQSAKANVNCRIFPGDEVAAIHGKLREVVASEAVEVSLIGNPQSAPASTLREDVMDAVTKAAHSIYPDVPIVPYMSAGATDSRALRASGIPAFGTTGNFMRDEDSFAHGLNERVLVKSFFDALEQWKIVVRELSGR